MPKEDTSKKTASTSQKVVKEVRTSQDNNKTEGRSFSQKELGGGRVGKVKK